MSALELSLHQRRRRLGLKGPRAADWLASQGIAVPAAPNSWSESGASANALLTARLGWTEFFLEGGLDSAIGDLAAGLDADPPGVYPVLREDWAFQLGGDGVHDVLAQVCNVNFSSLLLDSRPVVMTLMIGVAVLVVPQGAAVGQGGAADGTGASPERRYRIWCDPSFGPYLGESLGAVVNECGGRYTGVSG